MSVWAKYPRTPHLPWSEGVTRDDRVIETLDEFYRAGAVVITEKMDGECTTLRRDGLHARSLDYSPHSSRTRIRALHARVAHNIPEGWRVVGENCYAKHSIHYQDLPAYFMVFAIFDAFGTCLSWCDTVEWCQLLDLCTVPVFIETQWSEDWIKGIFTDDVMKDPQCEGYVARVGGEIEAEHWARCVAKYVRRNHVQTDEHWMRREVIPNELQSSGRPG